MQFQVVVSKPQITVHQLIEKSFECSALREREREIRVENTSVHHM